MRSSGYVWRLARTEGEDPSSTHAGRTWDGSDTLSSTDEPDDREGELPAARPTEPVQDDDARPATSSALGSSGTRDVALLAESPGIDDIHLRLTRPWLDEGENASARATVRVAPEKTLNGYSTDQTAAHATRLANTGR